MSIDCYKIFQLDKINPLIFITPAIALILVALMFIYLVGKVDNKEVFKRLSFIILALAFLLNFAWEVIQMPLYKGASFKIAHVAYCVLASVADAIMVLLIFFGFALFYKNPFWVRNLTLRRIVILMLVGGIGAIIAEMRHVSAGSWAYNNSMPIIPIIDVGLSPVLQFILLPVGIYYFGFRITKSLMKQHL